MEKNEKAWLFETELKGKNVTLRALQKGDAAALVKAAADGELWDLWYASVPGADSIRGFIDYALAEQKAGRCLPFVVVGNRRRKVIGSTRLCNADSVNKRIEIGYTWYARKFQRTIVNTECKYLLLRFAFQHLSAIAVEFRTHWHNHASRNALSRLGAKQDGVLRNHKIMPDGSMRDTVIFSIIAQEWPAVKSNLLFKLGVRR